MNPSNIIPTKELVNPLTLTDTIKSSLYPKPQWMLNNNVYDTTWLFARVGIDKSFFENNIGKAHSFTFKKLVAPHEYLTDKSNEVLLTDIQNSLLYLNIVGKITRPVRIIEIALGIIKLIKHANELRIINNEPLVRNLEQIKFKELKDYFLSFKVERDAFDKTLGIILINYKSKNEIDWDLIKTDLKYTSRKLNSLKNKMIKYLKSNEELFDSVAAYYREYLNANTQKFDPDFHLSPSESSISNEISKLEAIYTAKASQKYKFRHSPMELFSSGRTIFDEMIERAKTPLMPISISLHAISHSLHFSRVYGEALRQYLYNLSKAEELRIQDLGIMLSTSRADSHSIQEYAYAVTKIPEELNDLNITSWLKHDKEAQSNFSNFRKSMSVSMAVRLYTASIWIQLASFTASRTTSLLTLKRNCFVLSPVDGLFDLILRIPKSSERLALEEVHRPIPDLIYDYGIEFATLACELEERRGLVRDESELFLFGAALSYRSISASRKDGGRTLTSSLGKDYILASLDMFMDWIESPLIDDKRWYPTTHQFRRSFAVIYFNFSDSIGLDELSWFMGHANLEQTFYYAEISPDDEWIHEAELTIAKIGASLNKTINSDDTIKDIIAEARKTTNISIILEPLVIELIDKHKKKTGQQVRFRKIQGQNIFFYFTKTEGQ